MKNLIFATGNAHKVREIQQMLDVNIQILSLKDIGWLEDIPETADTIAGNAVLKANTVFQALGKAVFAEDTGLEVTALDGAPGVYTARYAGPQRNAADNIQLLLKNLLKVEDRSARFKTVISLILSPEEHYTFEGICEGQIAEQPSGNGGFGYDPIFIPEGYKQTFAELSPTTKNRISHRGRAFRKFLDFLQNNKRT